jgi:hypothetical protein
VIFELNLFFHENSGIILVGAARVAARIAVFVKRVCNYLFSARIIGKSRISVNCKVS